MSFWDKENSLIEGVPYELHEFQLGDSAKFWRYADAPVDVSYAGHAFVACYCPGGRIEQGGNAIKSQTVVKVDWRNPFAWQYTTYGVEEIVHYVRYKGHGPDVAPVYQGDVVDVLFRQADRKGRRWAEIIIDPLTAAMRRSGLVLRYSRQCGVELYGSVCGVARANHQISGTLDGVSANILTSATFGTQASGWWTGGDIVVNGRRRLIVEHMGDDVRIWPAAPDLAGGQSFTVCPGCDHLLTTCDTKFDNLAANPGQPNVPDKNPMDYGIVGI